MFPPSGRLFKSSIGEFLPLRSCAFQCAWRHLAVSDRRRGVGEAFFRVQTCGAARFPDWCRFETVCMSQGPRKPARTRHAPKTGRGGGGRARWRERRRPWAAPRLRLNTTGPHGRPDSSPTGFFFPFFFSSLSGRGVGHHEPFQLTH